MRDLHPQLGRNASGRRKLVYQLALFLKDPQVHAVAGEVVLSSAPTSLDRLDCILDHVAERLPELPAVADHVELAF